ncbi:MAG: hypothetical protein ACKPKO_60305, partial [Candidatus Fonsibacter sp.]
SQYYLSTPLTIVLMRMIRNPVTLVNTSADKHIIANATAMIINNICIVLLIRDVASESISCPPSSWS